ncbi:HAUS augmin-like complex subunit 6 N-terminus-domain-containing protein [Xylaria digitata]|nr:HAUS augmin-like complex subunit 6 N-terminus-domain-containing protein [Xylaria digitata]
MSSYQSNSSVARTRPLRTTSKPTLTAPQTSTPLINKSPQIPTCTSNVLLFLTNLRLLDLDLEPDWPDITPATFSAKDAVGGQKKRIQCVEWALYQLFSLWDHNDAQNKLRPFYPPADQVQSINLRAALVRSLEAAKKNGVLGRDVLIRKTMLDECKGERLEEVLAVFSSAVLKKLVAERALNSGPEYRPTISESISLENWGYTGDRTELNGLLLAHKASLRSILEKKRAAREKYRDFGEFLAVKERGVSRRQEQARLSSQDGSIVVSDTERAEVRRILRNNWAGNEQWVDGLLGGHSSQKRGLLSTPFDEVWGGVQAGNITDLEGRATGLLEQLEQRVFCQKTRLQKWEDFRRSTFGDVRPRVARNPPPREKKPENSLDFTAHLNIDFNELMSSSNVEFDNPPPEYATMINGLTKELGELKSRKIPDFSSLITSTRRRPVSITSAQFIPEEPVLDPVSDLSDWEDEPEEVIPQPKAGESSINRDARPTSIPRGFSGSRRQLPVPRENRRASPVRHEDPAEFPREHRRLRTEPCASQVEHKPSATDDDEFNYRTRNEEKQVSYSHPNHSRSPTRTNNAISLPPRPKSPTQLLADEILNSMNNASPSPMKKSRYTLSLAERTRMSMTRTPSFEPEDVTPQHSPVKASHAEASGGLTTNNDPERGEEYEDLITRTRRSMAGFEAARQKAQLERRRSQRKSKVTQRKDSYFPRVDEEAGGDLSIVEGLMEDGHDYEAIFKSRPRIATSPMPSPTRRSYEEE